MQHVDGKFYSDDDDDEMWTFPHFCARRQQGSGRGSVEGESAMRRVPIEGRDQEQRDRSSSLKSKKLTPKGGASSPENTRIVSFFPTRPPSHSSLTIQVPSSKSKVPLYKSSIDPRRHKKQRKLSPEVTSPASRYRADFTSTPTTQPHSPDLFENIMRDVTPTTDHSLSSFNRFSPLAADLPDILTDDSIESKLSEDVEKLNQQLLPLDLKVHIIKPDGNCAFRALSFLMHGTERRHLYYRKKVVSVMRKNKDYFKDFVPEDFDEHCDKMECLGEWADNVELFAMSLLVRKKILVHQLNHEPQSISAFEDVADTINFSYHIQCHYNCVVPVERGSRPEDDPITQIMKLTGEIDRDMIGRFLEVHDYNVNNTVEAILKQQEERHTPTGHQRRTQQGFLDVSTSPADDGFLTPSSFAGGGMEFSSPFPFGR